MFLKAEKLQNHSNEGKGGRKRKSEEKERREREKSNGFTLRFYNSYFGDSFCPKITVGRRKVHFLITF